MVPEKLYPDRSFPSGYIYPGQEANKDHHRLRKDDDVCWQFGFPTKGNTPTTLENLI